MYTHIYIRGPLRPPKCLQKVHRPTGPCHIMVQKSAHQPNKKGISYTSYNQGASSAPPAAPPSGGGGGPPSPAPGGGGGTPAGPPCPGGRRPLVIAAATAARRTKPRHGAGTPTHCSRNPSSWMWDHMPSGTSRSTVSKRRHKSSISPPAAAGGACDGPAPGSSKRRLCAGLSAPAGWPAASSHGRLSPRGGLPSRRTGGLYSSTSRPRGAKSAHAPNNKQTMISVSIHQNICTNISTA
jgi:hypothetical protein